MEVDWLGALPEHLLVDIIRRLGLKEAPKTAILSRQWRFLWRNCNWPLCFWDYSTEIEGKRRFAASVNAVLALSPLRRDPRAFELLSVDFIYDGRLASDVDSCLDFAAKNKVKNVYLRLRSDFDDFRRDRYYLPQVIYSNSSMTHLSLENCIAWVNTPVEWRCLKSLSLWSVEFRQQKIGEILSGCPILEDLSLEACSGFDRLEIGGRSFRDLSVTHFRGDFLEIWAPYMKHLHLHTSMEEMVRLENVASLKYAEFDLCIPSSIRRLGSTSLEAIRTAMERFLHLGRDLKELGVSSDFSQALSIMATHGWRFPQLMRVEVLDISGASICGVLAMLESCPCVQELVLTCYVPGEDEYRKKKFIDWGPIKRDDLTCDLMHLKTVKFEDYCDASDSGEPTFTMAKILLKRAPLLEKIVIYKSNCFSTKIYEDMKNQLVQSPKSSEKASIDIQ